MKYNKIFKNYKNLKVLITGSTGFKGSWLTFWLEKLGAKVVGVGLPPEKNSIIFQKLDLDKNIKQYFIDITNYTKINSIIKKEKPDLIFHLAAQSIVSLGYKNPINTFMTNIIGSANILQSFRTTGTKGLIYVSSDKCYLNLNKNRSFKESDPLGGLDNYSSSKASAENIFLSYHHSYFKNNAYCKAVSVRAGNVVGGGDFKENRIVPDIINSIYKKKKLIIRNPNSTRPWQHVLEPLSGYLLLGQKILDNKIRINTQPSYNFGPNTKNCQRVKFLIKSIQLLTNKKIKFSISKKKEFSESKLLRVNIDKAKKELKWTPKLNLHQTLDFTCQWYKSLFEKKNVKKITLDQISIYSEK